jgi:antitoxin HicB
LPELITEGDTIRDTLENVGDALAAVIELYAELGRSLPKSTLIPDTSGTVWFETLISTA